MERVAWTARAEEQGNDRSNELRHEVDPVDDVNRKPNETCGLVQCQDTMTGTVTGEGDKDMGRGQTGHTVPRNRRR